ncbi:MAG TPA: nitroreductase family protein [Candidatus Gastranaerophilaceae bacterium]|nr:nitroreductase family protein [Candidatus Gastranaerophilaceae bacterium]
MNSVIQNILNRRSVRVYSDEPVKKSDLDLILKAGMYAPSGCNMQPWHFTVIQDKELIKTLSNESKKEFINHENEMFRKMAANKDYNIFYNAPMIIVISGEKSSPTSIIDCSAATQNMILASESMSMGTCWIGLITFLFKGKNGKKWAEKINIPENYEPYYAITLGYKKYPDPKAPDRRKNVINYI